MKKYRYPAVGLMALALSSPMMLTACASASPHSSARTVDDATITTRVKTALLNDPEVGGLRIDVETFNGVVTLSGQVKTPVERDKALAVARKISGVSDVKSSLQVQ